MEEKNNLKVPTTEKATESHIIIASNQYYLGVSNQMGTCPTRGIRANESWTLPFRDQIDFWSLHYCDNINASLSETQRKFLFEHELLPGRISPFSLWLLSTIASFRRTTTLLGNIGLVRPTDASIVPIEYCKCS